MSYKNLIHSVKEKYFICCYECRIKVSYFVNCSDKLTRKVIQNLTEERSLTPYSYKYDKFRHCSDGR